MRTQTLRLGDVAQPTAASTPTAEAEQEDAPAAVTGEPPATDTADATTEAPVVAAAREPEPAPAVATSPPPPAATPPRPAPAPAATGGDWTVQLGSFSEEANARRVAQRSGTFGYKAEVSTIKRGGRTLYRVRVGSARSRAEAEATVSALKAHGVDASVVAAR
jgi:cell division protein FtsN